MAHSAATNLLINGSPVAFIGEDMDERHGRLIRDCYILSDVSEKPLSTEMFDKMKLLIAGIEVSVLILEAASIVGLSAVA